MTQVPPSPMIPIDNEKDPRHYEAEMPTGIIETSDSKEVVGSSDGDDALKLAGIQAHQFDEKFYLRLRRKIVSHLERKHVASI